MSVHVFIICLPLPDRAEFCCKIAARFANFTPRSSALIRRRPCRRSTNQVSNHACLQRGRLIPIGKRESCPLDDDEFGIRNRLEKRDLPSRHSREVSVRCQPLETVR